MKVTEDFVAEPLQMGSCTCKNTSGTTKTLVNQSMSRVYTLLGATVEHLSPRRQNKLQPRRKVIETLQETNPFPKKCQCSYYMDMYMPIFPFKDCNHVRINASNYFLTIFLTVLLTS